MSISAAEIGYRNSLVKFEQKACGKVMVPILLTRRVQMNTTLCQKIRGGLDFAGVT
jgi:hypothetical protein